MLENFLKYSCDCFTLSNVSDRFSTYSGDIYWMILDENQFDRIFKNNMWFWRFFITLELTKNQMKNFWLKILEVLLQHCSVIDNGMDPS